METRIKVLLSVLLLLTLPTVVQAQYFYDGDYYCFSNSDSTITISGYRGSGGVVTIPITISSLPVTSIGDFAFIYKSDLTSITLPNRTTSIGISAFLYCSGLTNATIGNSVTNIGDNAFGYCYRLISATIPSGVTSIGASAFYYCANLNNVTIPSSVTNIGDGAFRGCNSMSSITVDTLNSVFSSVDGVLFNKSETALIQYPGAKPGSDYTITNSVTSIGSGAFLGCNNLTSMTIPSSVTDIGGYTFYDCPNLTSIVIPNSVISIGAGAFPYCSSLTNVSLGNGFATIGDHAFSGCTSLTTITIPHRVTSIGDYAFYSCSSLAGIYFQGDAPGLGSDVFLDSANATVYYLPGTLDWGSTFGGLPTAQWFLPNPLILNNSPSLGVKTNQFGFIISWATNIPVVVEACTSLVDSIWSPLKTNTLTGGWSYFSDPNWTNYPGRFYRIRSP